MSFGPCFPDITPNTPFSFASPCPRPRLIPNRRRSHSLSRTASISHPDSASTSAALNRFIPFNDQNETSEDVRRREERELSRSPEDRSVLMGRRQESTVMGLRRILSAQRPLGTDMTRADDDLNDQESRLIQMDEGIRTFGRGFLLPPGCRQTVDEHDQQQASMSPSEAASHAQAQEDQANLSQTGNSPPAADGEEGDANGTGVEVDLDADMEDMDVTGVTGDGDGDGGGGEGGGQGGNVGGGERNGQGAVV